MGKVVDASDATFDDITGTGWVLVDFWAPGVDRVKWLHQF